MAEPPPNIRPAEPGDAASIATIYSHHALHGVASFDFAGWPPEIPARKIAGAREGGWPFLVAEADGTVLGYAYAAPFRDRPGYAHTCETSIYVHPGHLGRGIGAALLVALVEAAESAGFRQMIAVIGGPERASVALHRAAGFHEAGRMRSVGRKQGRWLDTLYMQRALGEGDSTAPGPDSPRSHPRAG